MACFFATSVASRKRLHYMLWERLRNSLLCLVNAVVDFRCAIRVALEAEDCGIVNGTRTARMLRSATEAFHTKELEQ